VVEKIWLKEFLGAKLEYWKNSRAIYVYTESRKGVCVKRKGPKCNLDKIHGPRCIVVAKIWFLIKTRD
jgi:hypothetical protein